MGFIYIIRSTETNKVYIGQTKTPIKERWSHHKNSYRSYVRHKNGQGGRKDLNNSAIYAAMLKYDLDTFSIHRILEVQDTDLNDFEKFYISLYNSLAPNGYNLTGGGSDFHVVSESTSELIRENNRRYRRANIDKFRSEELQGLPLFTNYCKPKNGKEFFAVSEWHPKCKNRKTFFVETYGSKEAAKEAMLEFLKELENSDQEYIREKKSGNELPKGLSKLKTGGYLVRKRHNKKTYEKRFMLQSQTDEQNKEAALKYLEEVNKIIEELKKNKNTSPETKH
jgi:hypothetical protein